jgi:uncharacterized RmlC-like cupin family protein
MREHIELETLDLKQDWSALAGHAGLQVKVLADSLDVTARSGARSRLVRFAPGARTQEVLRHDYWEEVYLLSGDLARLDGRPAAAAFSFSIRPPGTPHGPFASSKGCVLLELQYFVA